MVWNVRLGSSAFRPWLVFPAYLAVTSVMVWPVFNFAAADSACYWGDVRLNAWALAWNHHAILSGAVDRYFDANIFYPASGTLAMSEHLFGIALLTLPVQALFQNATLTYNLAWLLSFPLCAWAAYRLAWLHVGHHGAAFIAGLLYAFAFFRVLHVGHLQLLWAFLLPLSMVTLESWYATGRVRSLVGWTAALLLQCLSSWYLAVLALLANALKLLFLLVRPRSVRDVPANEAGRMSGARFVWSRAGPLMGAAGCVALVLVLFARPYLEGPQGDPMEPRLHSADWFGYLVPPRDTLAGRWLLQHGIAEPRWSFGERTTYLGWAAIALAVVGVGSWLRSRRLRQPGGSGTAALGREAYWLTLGGLALVLSLGPSPAGAASDAVDGMPFSLFTSLTGLTLFRAPARFALLVTLALAILGAVGARALLARGRRGALLTWALVLLFLVESFPAHYELGKPSPAPIPAVYRMLADLPRGVVVSLPSWVDTPVPMFEADYQLFSTVHWMPIVNGYSRLAPPGYAETMRQLSTFPSAEAAHRMRQLGVRYVVFHAKRYDRDLRAVVRAAKKSPAFELLAEAGDDTLWRLSFNHEGGGANHEGHKPSPRRTPRIQQEGHEGIHHEEHEE